MEQIIEHIPEQNKEWAKSLSPKDIANILNILATIPGKIKPKIEKGAANIGKIGENAFENIIDKFLPNDYKLENVAKQGKAGDFKLSWLSHKTGKIYKIMIDVKKYSSTVPSKEVDKFYRDLNINKVDGGLLLSLNSKICGMSKVIDFKEYQNDTGKTIPVLFAVSESPLVIAEIIKLSFHSIEIKDLCSNGINSFDELYLCINQLNDNVQIIMDCRDLLHKSKSDIEKNLNEIMYKLMNCEYSLVAKINTINTTLVTKYELKQNKPEQTNVSMINTIIETFEPSEELTTLLYQIFNVGWDDSSMDITKKIWILNKGDNKINIKLKNNRIIFPILTESINVILNEISKEYKKKGIDIAINTTTIHNIIKICELL